MKTLILGVMLLAPLAAFSETWEEISRQTAINLEAEAETIDQITAALKSGTEQPTIRERLNRRLALAKASFAASRLVAPEQRSLVADWVRATEAFDLHRTQSNAQNVLAAYRDLVKALPAENPVIPFIVQHYANHNFHLTVGESLFLKMATKSVTKSGPIRDVILNSDVTGHQTTTTTFRPNHLPSTQGARMLLELRGETVTQGVGVPRQAPNVRLHSAGRHFFTAKSEVNFDEENFTHTPPRVSVDANTRITGVGSTRGDGLLGFGLVKRIESRGAVRKAHQNQGTVEAIIAQKLSHNVATDMTKTIQTSMGELIVNIRKNLISPLQAANLKPDHIWWTSTETSIDSQIRSRTEQELGGGAPPEVSLGKSDFMVRLHSSMLQNAANGLALNGQKLTSIETKKKVAALLKDIFHSSKQSFEPKPSEGADDTKFLFAAKDAVTVVLENGEVVLELVTGIQQPGKDPIPPHRIRIPIQIKLTEDAIQMEYGDIRVKALQQSGSAALQAKVLRKSIMQILPDPKPGKRSFVASEEGAAQKTTVRIDSLGVTGEWLVLLASLEFEG